MVKKALDPVLQMLFFLVFLIIAFVLPGRCYVWRFVVYFILLLPCFFTLLAWTGLSILNQYILQGLNPCQKLRLTGQASVYITWHTFCSSAFSL